MKKNMFLIFLVFIVVSVKGQINKTLSDSCSNVLMTLQYFWKNDSLGTNGYRLLAYPRLLTCKMDKVSEKEVFEVLGKPSKVVYTNKDYEWRYDCFNTKKISTSLFGTEWVFVSFNFSKKTNLLLSVDVSHYDEP